MKESRKNTGLDFELGWVYSHKEGIEVKMPLIEATSSIVWCKREMKKKTDNIYTVTISFSFFFFSV